MSLGVNIIAAVIALSFLTVYCYIAFYVARHARRRGSDHWLFHGVMTLLFNLVYAGLYFIMNGNNNRTGAAQ